jgi:hypothetical protein
LAYWRICDSFPSFPHYSRYCVLPDLFFPTIIAQPDSLDHTIPFALHVVAVEEDSGPIAPVVPWRVAYWVFDVDAGVEVNFIDLHAGVVYFHFVVCAGAQLKALQGPSLATVERMAIEEYVTSPIIASGAKMVHTR